MDPGDKYFFMKYPDFVTISSIIMAISAHIFWE